MTEIWHNLVLFWAVIVALADVALIVAIIAGAFAALKGESVYDSEDWATLILLTPLIGSVAYVLYGWAQTIVVPK